MVWSLALLRPFALLCAGCLAVLLIGGCASDPDSKKQNFLASGDRYFSEGKYSEASIEYRNAIEVDRRFAQAHTKLAAAQARNGQLSEALASYIRAADSEPQNVDYQLVAGNALLVARRFDEANARATTVIKLDPKNVQGFLLQGSALAALNNPEQALARIEEAIQLDPTRSTSYTSLAMLEASQGRRAEAEAAFRKAVELDPRSSRIHLTLGNYLWSSGRTADAEVSYRRAVQLSPDDSLSNRALAAFYLASGRIDEGERYLAAAAAVDDNARLVLGEYYLANKRPQSALAEFESLRVRRPTSGAVIRGLAKAHAELGDRAKAESLIDELLKRSPSDADTLLMKGQLRFAAGEKDKALPYLKSAAESNPNSAPVHFTLGKLFVALGEIDEAERAFNRVLTINPRAAVAQTELSALHLLKGGTEASKKYAENAVALQPQNVDARLALVRGHLAAGEVAKAEAELQPLATSQPANAGVATLSGVIAARKKDAAAARSAFERALQLDPSAIEALSGLVELDLLEQKPAEAKLRVERQLKATKPRADVLTLAAHLASRTGDERAAESFLRRAIEADPNALQAYVTLGQIYISQGRLDAAKAEFEALSRHQTRPVAALTMAGMVGQVMGRTSEARVLFERVLAMEPRAVVAANNLAWIYAESGENLDVALELAKTAAVALPKSAEVQDTLGWVYYKKKLSSEAVTTLTKCVDIDPRNSMYRYHLGMAHLQAGNTSVGREMLERVLAENPRFFGADDARRALARP
jgi:tetratricopeptide (TPR) repeat protein